MMPINIFVRQNRVAEHCCQVFVFKASVTVHSRDMRGMHLQVKVVQMVDNGCCSLSRLLGCLFVHAQCAVFCAFS